MPWRTVAGGVALQELLGVAGPKLPVLQTGSVALDVGLLALQDATRAGTAMVFGHLGGGPLP